MRSLDYDVVVVGAGPGGSTAARFAAQGGARTLLIEKRQEIGSPVRCGEGIAKDWLPSVDIPYDRRWVAQEVDGAKIISPAGHVVTIDAKYAGNEVGVVVERDAFDKYCAYLAAKAGSDILIKTSAVGVTSENGVLTGIRARRMGEPLQINAKVIIAADGFESQVGRWAGIDTTLKANDVISALQYRMVDLERDHRYCEFYIGKKFTPGGYVWVFSKGEDIANVGIGVQLSKVRGPNEVQQRLNAFIESMPGLKRGKTIDMVAGAVSISAPLEHCVRSNLMLVGDAARVIDPVTGGGISHACVTGKEAGMVAAESIQSGDHSEEFLQRYESRWREILEPKLYRDWMAKEKLSTLSDEMLDRIVKIISETTLEKLSVYTLLAAIKEKDPDLVKELEDLI